MFNSVFEGAVSVSGWSGEVGSTCRSVIPSIYLTGEHWSALLQSLSFYQSVEVGLRLHSCLSVHDK